MTEVEKKVNPILRFMRTAIIIQSKVKADTSAYNYKYCTLQDVLKVAIAELGKNNLGLKQYYKFYNALGSSTIVTEIIDCEDNKVLINSELPLANTETNTQAFNLQSSAKDKNINQEVGATLTYYRRYALYCILGIQPEKDLDGETYSGFKKKNTNH